MILLLIIALVSCKKNLKAGDSGSANATAPRAIAYQLVWADEFNGTSVNTFAHPVSFRHTADGYGVEVTAGLRYRAGSRVFVNMGAGYFNWQTGAGIDQLYLSAGGSQQTQLNGVLREGWRGMLGVEVGLF